ncbi:Bug family tripartite tricarboxylate transporter substrate binding protein [Variovorax guangxiensis]|uniref:Tripartite tricarboxylate transporter substrate binding protein n=1 Tax=Variovorax guangxiensis TaxID=1775474 RepID=A0A502DMA0_9BURK|nr:tripartite tricarboxylate transporter substrate-binding protein [Variovorax guangxiensis]RZI64840.1 MAG: tripartite tricarboxylate transporter substrate binding protein [Variovorax sp.]TPG21912.1 tripartite tricarboxylate transporter substrate binding protein [Variovorax ginsengisoli]TPG25800.1 tripartite tricarboxylate transporter substrate binding protein [Variovorax guangxiensis]
MSLTRSLALALGAAAGLSLAMPSAAQDTYPSRPVKVVVALPAGGSVDMVARMVGQQLAADLGQPFVVDNRAGASGQIGVPVVAKAAPDGYTLMVSPASFLTTNKSIWKTLPYNPEADFAPVTKLVNQAMVLVVRDKTRLATPAQVLAAAKAAPGKLTYASSGDGSPQHLAGLLFESRTGVKLLHIPYKGGAPAITDLMGGVVDMAFSPLPEALPYIKSGRLHPVGLLSDKRSASAPDIPTLREGGVDNVVLSAWIGLLAPAKTPQPILDRLDKSVKAMLRGDAKGKLLELGMEPAVDDAKPLAQVISEEIRLHAELVKAAGLVPQ